MFINILCDYYIDEQSIRRILDQSQIDASKINFNTNVKNIWFQALIEAKKQNKLLNLVFEVSSEYSLAPEVYSELLETEFKRMSSHVNSNQRMENSSNEIGNIRQDIKSLDTRLTSFILEFSKRINTIETRLEYIIEQQKDTSINLSFGQMLTISLVIVSVSSAIMLLVRYI